MPRVNSALLSKNVNKTVRLVGSVLGLQGSQAVLEASDKGQVVVHLTPVRVPSAFDVKERS